MPSMMVKSDSCVSRIQSQLAAADNDDYDVALLSAACRCVLPAGPSGKHRTYPVVQYVCIQ